MAYDYASTTNQQIYGNKSGGMEAMLNEYDYLRANNPKSAGKYLKKMSKNFGFVPDKVRADVAAAQQPAPENPQPVSYDEMWTRIKNPLMAEMENWYTNNRDKSGHVLADTMYQSMQAPAEMEAYERAWREQGGEGLSPQMQAYMEDRQRSEEVRQAMGIDPTHAYDAYSGGTRQQIGDQANRWQQGVDDVNADTAARKARLEADWGAHGPGGSRYGALDDQTTARLGQMGGAGYHGENQDNTIDNLNALMQGVQDQSQLSGGVNDMLTAATRGELTAPGAAWLDSQVAARKPVVDDMLRQVKEQAGAQRGIGGGRFAKQLADTGQRAYDDIFAKLNDIQQQTANQAVDFQTSKRGQDINLAQLGANMQGNVSGTQMNANQAAGNYVGNMARLGMEQENMLHGMAKEPLENQMAVDQATLNNMYEQLKFDEREKDRTIETHVDPYDAMMEDVMAYRELLNMDLGKETKLSKAQKKAKKNVEQNATMGLDGIYVGETPMTPKQQKQYDNMMKRISVREKIGNWNENPTLTKQMKKKTFLPA